MSILTAQLSISETGVPFSTTFDDVYHSDAGGPGQVRHVFIEGNHLPARWQADHTCTVLETGFGLGLNFLATWQAWREAQAPGQLHFISVEKFPFTRADLARLHEAFPELAPLAAQLQTQWPDLVPGLHRLSFEHGRVTLTLGLGDALELLPQINARVDAFYLDGFSPAKNPELWSPAVYAQLRRLAAPGATLATWSVTGHVRRGLQEAGFHVERRPGFGSKREMLTGRLADDTPPPPAPARERRALVLGAGVAGTSVAERLAARGWQITLLDENAAPGQGASGNRAGVFRPLPSLDDNRLARITRAGFVYGKGHLARLLAGGHPLRWGQTGVLHLARDDKQAGKMRAVVDAHQPPADYLQYLEPEAATALIGWPVAQGGWFFPQGGWIQPPSLCAANLAAAGDRVEARFNTRVAQLVRDSGRACWQALDASGAVLAEAPVLILANGVGIRQLPEAGALPVRLARGQVSHLPAEAGSAPKMVVCRLGYVSPEVDGVRCAGATFMADDEGTELRLAEHQENLEKLDFILPGYSAGIDPAALDGRVGFRPASPDRLPMVGPVPVHQPVAKETPLHAIERHPGLYAVSGFGARGLVWASLMGELLASQLEGEPLPLEQDLVDALDPARYLLKPPRPQKGNEE